MNTENAHHMDTQTALSIIRDYNKSCDPLKALDSLTKIVHHWHAKGTIDEYEANYYIGMVYGFYYGRDYEQSEYIATIYDLD